MVNTDSAELLANTDPGSFLLVEDSDGDLGGKYHVNKNVVIGTVSHHRRAIVLQIEGGDAQWLTGAVDRHGDDSWTCEHLAVSSGETKESLQPTVLPHERFEMSPADSPED